MLTPAVELSPPVITLERISLTFFSEAFAVNYRLWVRIPTTLIVVLKMLFVVCLIALV